jgi:hypothetical protein
MGTTILGSSSTMRISLGIKFILAVFAYKPEEIFAKFILLTPKGFRFKVQMLQPMDTAPNISQHLEYPSYPNEGNGFITRQT